MMRLLSILLIIIVLTLINVARGGGVSLSKPGCPQKCGKVIIPYPFGIGSKCSYNSSFTVACPQNATNPPKPYLTSIGGLEVVEISLDLKTVRVMHAVFPLNCSSKDKLMRVQAKSLVGSPYTFASPLTVVGCNIEVRLMDLLTNSSSQGCRPICGLTTYGCYGINCCRINTLATGPRQELVISYTTYDQQANDHDSCGYAFVADFNWFMDDQYRHNYYSFQTQSNQLNRSSSQYVAMTLEWDFDSTSTHNLQGVSCEENMFPYFVTLDSNITYLYKRSKCSCDYGFEGNPYLGCQDIDECRNTTLRNCTSGTTCVNAPGSFMCLPDVDNNHIKSVVIGICSGGGALLMLIGIWMSSKIIKKRMKVNRKKKFLQQKLSSIDGGSERIKLFSSKELAKATDDYNENRVLGRGGQGIVYKGMLTDGRIVAVKKSEKTDEADIDTFINEVVILSQINHRNVVRLLGCCLNAKALLLVNEFVPNGTLFQHIHDHESDEYFPLSWKMRLRIAVDVAEALSYLHNAASLPIYHRDIKSTNILLDDKYRAKVSDFGTSRSISIDQTHLTTRVIGTFGYLDPEYFQSSQFTEKSDVYSFGVVMVELLTGEKAISIVGAETGRNLATLFLRSMDETNLSDILDLEILKEGRMEEIVGVAKLARRCLNLAGKRRPTMKEVAATLVGIQMEEDNLEDAEFCFSRICEDYDFPSSSNSSNTNVIISESSECSLLFDN